MVNVETQKVKVLRANQQNAKYLVLYGASPGPSLNLSPRGSKTIRGKSRKQLLKAQTLTEPRV